MAPTPTSHSAVPHSLSEPAPSASEIGGSNGNGNGRPGAEFYEPHGDPIDAAVLGETGPPSLLLLALEGRAVWELASCYVAQPWLLHGVEGDGHPVMVLPGFIASGTSTAPLRRYLAKAGWSPHCWKMGRNLGLDPSLERNLLARLRELAERYQQKVSLVGWSLGGVYSRWLANREPDLVRCVVTLGSPFNDNPRANHSWRLFERVSGQALDQIDPETFRLIRENPPVPTTSIYSLGDGITAWQCCVLEEGRLAENVEVAGSHCGLGVNPLALHVIADRLSQDPERWQKFRRTGMRRYLYRRPSAHALQ